MNIGLQPIIANGRAANPSVFSVFNHVFPRNVKISPESQLSFPSIIILGILKATCIILSTNNLVKNTEK
jgi:hypothetical protein